jgi:HEAT repeat protein
MMALDNVAAPWRQGTGAGMEGEIRTAAEALRQLHEEDPWFSYPDAVDLLSTLHPGEGPALVAALDDPSKKIRAAVARALSAYPIPAARAGLLQALHDPVADVRRAAIGGLGAWDDAEVVAALRDLLAGDPDFYTRLAAVQGMAGRPDANAAEALTHLLAAAPGDDPMLLGMAAEALAGFGGALAREPLVALLDHPAPAIRQKAVEGLATLGDAAAAGPLRAYAARETDAYLAGMAGRVAADLESRR